MRTTRRKLDNISESSRIPAKEWKRRISGAPSDAITKNLGRATQLAACVECKSRSATGKHIASRFTTLKPHRRNDAVHSCAFFPRIRSTQGHICSQMLIGEKQISLMLSP